MGQGSRAVADIVGRFGADWLFDDFERDDFSSGGDRPMDEK